MGGAGVGKDRELQPEQPEGHERGYYPRKSGGGSRRIMVTVGALAGDRISLTGSKTLAAGATGTLEVYPLNFE